MDKRRTAKPTMKHTFTLLAALLLASSAVLHAQAASSNAAATGRTVCVDITGNWLEKGAERLAHVQTAEPPLKPSEPAAFFQELAGVTRDYVLEFDYIPAWDIDPGTPGHAIGNQFEKFDGITMNGLPVVPVGWMKKSGKPPGYTLSLKLKAPADGRVRLGFTWRDTRPPITRITLPNPVSQRSCFQALAPVPSAQPVASPGELLVAHGIPFLSAGISYDRQEWMKGFNYWHPDASGVKTTEKACPILPWDGKTALNAGDVETDVIHFLGMIHFLDWGNGSWGSPKGDFSYNHFVGDKAGDLLLAWTDGSTTEIPLIFGFNLWYSRPWDMCWHFNPGLSWKTENFDGRLLGGKPGNLEMVSDALALVDGIRPRGALSSNGRFIFSVDCGGRKLRSVALRNVPELKFGPLVSAVTIETKTPSAKLRTLPSLSTAPLNVKTVTLADITEGRYQQGMRNIMRLFYTFVDELPKLDRPQVPKNYFGPAYDFRGSANAIYAANYLYVNGPGNAAFIADRGMGCGSPVFRGQLVGFYCDASGMWYSKPSHFKSLENWFKVYLDTEPGKLPGHGNAWSRGVGENLREAMALGYDKFAGTYVDWMDEALMRNAVPPHWTRIIGNNPYPQFVGRTRKVGGVTEDGNRENDGHGICMWGRYMVWHWGGRSQAWNKQRWSATKAAVDWIQWQLDTDTLFPGKRKDVLFTESECVHGGYEIYSSYNCLHGLKLSIRLAEQLGKKNEVEKWTALWKRLRQGLLDNLVDQDEFGPIWHTDEHCNWQDHAHKLAHIQLAPDGVTYTPLEDYTKLDATEQKYLEISRNSYRYLMKAKNYNCLRMYGYGQGMMTQSALLLDEMADASQFLDMLLRYSYLPNLDGWATPEGIITHRSGKYYLAVNGYSGQDAHIADSLKAVRLMLGIDDNDPARFRLIPRFPADWTHASIKEFPVLTGEHRQKFAYTYTRTADTHRLSFEFEQPVKVMDVRLGPLPEKANIVSVTANGVAVIFKELRSGDSRWVWVRNLSGKTADVVVSMKSP